MAVSDVCKCCEKSSVRVSEYTIQSINAIPSNEIQYHLKKEHEKLRRPTNFTSFIFGRLPDALQNSSVSGMIAVRKIESRHVHTRHDERFQMFDRPTGRSNGANNLGATRGNVGGGRDRVQINHATGEHGGFTRLRNRHD
jgi:hypothetical protein